MIGQNHGESTADRTRLTALTQCTYRRSVETTGQGKHCTVQLSVHGTLWAIDLPGSSGLSFGLFGLMEVGA